MSGGPAQRCRVGKYVHAPEGRPRSCLYCRSVYLNKAFRRAIHGAWPSNLELTRLCYDGRTCSTITCCSSPKLARRVG